jgi:hypothetical protein
MIINTGSRTDIPAYYSEWFYNRIKEGFVCVRNPYYPEHITRYRLSPDVVDCLGFCTKNPTPMLQNIGALDAFDQFWFVTITPYGQEIEPGVPQKEQVIEAFCKLSEHIGISSVGWRYDPIFISGRYTLDFHLRSFEAMARKLSGYTNHCVISFIDLYEKTKKNFPGVRQVTREERICIGKEFVAIGKKYGITIRTCYEGYELEAYGVDCAGCMTQQVIEQAIDCTLDVPKSKPAREGCNCLLGSDIGAYNTCGHGCLYCYANYDMEIVRQNMQRHDPNSPLLIGHIEPWETVKDAKQESWRDGQMRLSLW